MIISWKEKFAFDPGKISAAKFSILYYQWVVISRKEKLVCPLIYYIMYKYIYFLKEELDFDQEFKRGYEGILKKVD